MLQSGNSSQPKAVFFLSSPLGSGRLLATMQDIINASHFEEVIVFTAVCSAMHSVIEYGPANVTDDDSRAFDLYRSQIQEWLWLCNKVIRTLFINVSDSLQILITLLYFFCFAVFPCLYLI